MFINVNDISYEYVEGKKRKTALNHISCSIEKGKITALCGHTGSGKSTLLKVLSGLLVPTSGDFELPEIEKDEVRMVLQYPEYQLFEESVIKDVMFGPKNIGFSEEEARQEAVSALHLVGLDEESFEKSPFSLSGGQKRLVAIAGILAMKPKLILLDEPTAGLDPVHSERIMKIFKGINETYDSTIIIASHNMGEITEYAHDAVVLEKGEVLKSGRVSEIFSDEESLRTSGLLLPEAAKLLGALKKKNYDVDVTKIKEKESIEEVLRVLG